MATRICRGCGEDRDCETDFHAHVGGGRKDQKRSRCKQCANEVSRDYKIKGPAQRDFVCAACKSDFRREHGKGSRTLCDPCVEIGRMCPRCKEFKPHERFYAHRTQTKGTRYCKDGCVQAANRERLYGIERGTVDTVLAQFGGKCGICGNTETQGKKGSLHVDHCHTTGSIRGMLCGWCNAGIGYFRDDPELLAAAIEYLVRTRQLSFDESAA